MLHILLTILKIIGIIILVILGLIILIAACILFVPIRYRADISYEGKLSVRAKITYLLHLIAIRYDYEKSNFELRIFGFKTHFFDEKTKKKKKKYDKDSEMFEKMSKEISKTNDDTTNVTSSDMAEKYEQLKKIDEERDKVVDEDDSKTDIKQEFSEEEEDKESLLKRICNKIKRIFIKIKYRFRRFCGTIKKACKNIKELKEFLEDDNTKEAFHFVKDEVIILLKHIRPRKIKGYIHFGFDDPSYTGKLLGLIYIFTKGTHKNFQTNADFENKVLEGDVHFKGHITVFVLLIIALKLYRNENLKSVIERRRTHGRE